MGGVLQEKVRVSGGAPKRLFEPLTIRTATAGLWELSQFLGV